MKTMMIDECITKHWADNYPYTDRYPRSIDVLGYHASDEDILQYLIEHDYGLITCDHRFSLIALWSNIPVIFHRFDGSRYYTRPNTKQLTNVGRVDDPIAQYTLKHDGIVIP